VGGTSKPASVPDFTKTEGGPAPDHFSAGFTASRFRSIEVKGTMSNFAAAPSELLATTDSRSTWTAYEGQASRVG
jgi:hypothetical protein